MAKSQERGAKNTACRVCSRYGGTCPLETALSAGYSPGQVAYLMEELATLCPPEEDGLGPALEEAASLAGLRRIAFGKINDAVRLTSEETLTREELAGLDLYGVAELRRPKAGGCEVKFYDRLAALRLLLERSQGREEGGGLSLAEALNQSAASLWTTSGEGNPCEH